MKGRKQFVLLIVCAIFVTNVSFAAEKKVLFNWNSFGYKSGISASECSSQCKRKYNDPPLEVMLSQGWRIVNKSPKEAIAIYSEYTSETWKCTCKGTQYVLQKDDIAPKSTSKALSNKQNTNEELLKNENQSLKRENDSLKQEIKNLKDQLKLKHEE